MRVHLFNPDNDLALAANATHFTPPKAALRLRVAGTMLPLWYAEPDDKVLCYGVNARWLEQMQKAFTIDVDVFDHHGDAPALCADPWGWSLAARQDFLDEGFPATSLPNNEQLAAMRLLSHRCTALEVSCRLHEALPFGICGDGVETTTINEAEEAISHYGRAFVKAPWSSSGRGVVDTAKVGIDKALRMAGEFQKAQGSAIIEKAYDKSADFAMIFECAGGECRYLGLSVFTTDTSDGYTGNLIASEERRRMALGQHCSLQHADAIRDALQQIISDLIAPYYNGILGVDMLVTTNGCIHPSVEINLRKTMGYVALRLADTCVACGAVGTLAVRPGTLADAIDFNSLLIENHRLASGTLYLTPPNAHFAFEVKVGQ